MKKSKFCILAIDEKRITTDLDKAGYRKIGVQIYHASNFLEAQSILTEKAIDIIVINYDYEQVSAEAACQHFKSNKQTKLIPVVFTSIKSLPKKLTDKPDGPDLCIEQPIPRQFFIEKLRTLLEQKIRDTSRISYKGDATFTCHGKQHLYPIEDLSATGLLLNCNLSLDSGLSFDISFHLPGYKKPITVTGEVVRHISPKNSESTDFESGYGIKFISFHGDAQKKLEKYMLKSATEDPKMVYYL